MPSKPGKLEVDVVQREEKGGGEAAAEPTRGVLVRVPVSLHRRLKVMAAEADTTIQALMVSAIEELLEQRRW